MLKSYYAFRESCHYVMYMMTKDHDDGSDGAADNTEAAEDYKAAFFLRDFPRCGGVAVRIASRFMAAMMLLRARSMLKPASHQRCPFLWSYHRVIE